MSETCELCGEPFELDLYEVWAEDRAFMISTCCEGMHEAVIDELQGGSREPWIRDLFAGYGIDVRQVYAEDGCLRLDFGLELRAIARDDAKAFVAANHRHASNPPCGWKWGHAVYNGPELIGVAMVGRPVSRALDDGDVVEINRVCAKNGVATALTWNACSMLYGAARREAVRRKISLVITYTLEDELGTSLKAAGFVPVAKTKGGSWNRRGRPRIDKAPTCKKYDGKLRPSGAGSKAPRM
jgi:hypothetical protein